MASKRKQSRNAVKAAKHTQSGKGALGTSRYAIKSRSGKQLYGPGCAATDNATRTGRRNEPRVNLGTSYDHAKDYSG